MQVFKTIDELRAFLNVKVKEGATIGFVPTMGALHVGHLSLISAARKDCDLIVCSIFVNPIQFNNANDLARYPRNLEKDTLLLQKSDCAVLFAPTVEEIYPTPDTTKFNFDTLDSVMEGQFRPGHFNGVAVVVKRLFEIVKPHYAYFGEKDFQQLAIIKSMVRKLQLPVKVNGCPTMADTDGLALSSRNTLLSPEERLAAVSIPAALKIAQQNAKFVTVLDLKKTVAAAIAREPLLRLEYFEVADTETLQPTLQLLPDKKYRGFIACYAGKVRLIDNIALN